jgi:Na+-transporting NADH:ubiquinone oxidoreductase subunit NqrC
MAHAQGFSFLIMEQCFGPLAVEIIPGNHIDFGTYLAKKVRTQSLACAEVHFPIYGTGLWSPGSRVYYKKAL